MRQTHQQKCIYSEMFKVNQTLFKIGAFGRTDGQIDRHRGRQRTAHSKSLKRFEIRLWPLQLIRLVGGLVRLIADHQVVLFTDCAIHKELQRR